MVISPLAPDQTIAQVWSSGARGGLQLYIFTSLLYSLFLPCCYKTHDGLQKIWVWNICALFWHEIVCILMTPTHNVSEVLKNINLCMIYFWSSMQWRNTLLILIPMLYICVCIGLLYILTYFLFSLIWNDF